MQRATSHGVAEGCALLQGAALRDGPGQPLEVQGLEGKDHKGEIRLCARVGTFAQLEANDELNKMFYNPMAIRPFWKAFHEATGVHPSSIEGAELLDEAYHKALLDANEDERYEEADC